MLPSALRRYTLISKSFCGGNPSLSTLKPCWVRTYTWCARLVGAHPAVHPAMHGLVLYAYLHQNLHDVDLRFVIFAGNLTITCEHGYFDIVKDRTMHYLRLLFNLEFFVSF